MIFFVLELKRLYLPILLDVEGIFGIQLFFISDPLSDFDPRNSIFVSKNIDLLFKMRHYLLNWMLVFFLSNKCLMLCGVL